MKCFNCRSDKPEIHCIMRDPNTVLCKDCCEKYRNWDLCDTNCINFSREVSDAPLIKGVELTRVYDGHTHKTVEDIFLPNIFSQLYCDILNCQVNLFAPNRIEVDLVFLIKEQRRVNKEEYLKDNWKVKENGNDLIGLVPILQVYTFEHGSTKIMPNSFSIDNHPFIRFETTSYNYRTWQPFSIAKKDLICVKELVEFNEDYIIGRVIEGEGYFGKNDTIWAELLLDKEYKMKIEIRYSNLSIDRNSQVVKIPFGLYFPFGFVNYINYSINSSEDIKIEEDSKHFLIVPKEYRDEQIFLTPLEGNMNFIDGGGYCTNQISESDTTFHYDRFCIFQHDLAVKVDNGFVVNSKVSCFPIMVGLYNSMKRLYDGKYAPAHISIINSSEKIRRIKVKAKLKGLSQKFEVNINLRPYEFKFLPILPILRDDKLIEINEITSRSLAIDVYEGPDRIYSETHDIVVHPAESFIYNFQDIGQSFKTYLYQLLACYCTPHTKEIENIITEAAKEVGSIFGTLSNKYEKIMKELEAIYNVISKDMKYVTRSFNFSIDNMNETQRVSLPSTTLRLKSGNCIDLSLLLASAYEACKHNVELVLVPGYAFLAIQVTGMWMYIEATCLGSRSFTEAIQIGNDQFGKHFKMHDQPFNNNSRMISIKLARENGILPFK